MSPLKRRWRDYHTPAGHSPVRDYLMELPEDARAEVVAAMKDVRENGMADARHLRGEIYEVRASFHKMEYRVLFANEGSRGPDSAVAGGVHQEDAENASGTN